MKKLIITLLAAVLASGAFAQSSFPDIPANHWAGDAVERIADLGIVIGFPDGTFRGNEAFTRYQAALVVSRLLDVINDNVNAALALTQADVDSLRNAVQELASDVAAQGVRLSAAESAIAGLSDDAAATNARVADLEAALANAGAGGLDPAVLRDLQNQLASQRVLIDTAQATADAAAARADDAASQARVAAHQGRENAADINNLNRVIGLMQRDINALKSASGTGGEVVVPGDVDLSGVNSAIERNRSDIANIREFVILLRRDQVALRDRVSALEASDAAQDAAIADLEARVTELEENPLGISGVISVDYYVGRTMGAYDFDIDRVYGLNAREDMGASVFSTGARDLNGNRRIDVPGERAQDRADITQTPNATDGVISATLDLAFSYGFGFDGEGSPRALNAFSGVVSFGLASRSFDGPLGTGGVLLGDWLRVNRFTTTFEPIGAAPLVFTFGTNVQTTFTDYILETDDPGFLATLTAPDFLAFLNPTAQAVYVSPAENAYLRGARLTVNPLEGLVVGGSFAQRAALAGDKDNYLENNIEHTVFGVDASLAISIFELNVEWAQGSYNDQSTATTQDNGSVLVAQLGVNGEDLPIIESLNANYRSISANWVTDGYHLGADPDDMPFAPDQTGFGVNAQFDLFNIVDLGGFFDTYTTEADDSATAFGVTAGADLFAGFSLSGWFRQVSVTGTAAATTVDSLERLYDADEAAVALNGASIVRDANHDTSFGVELRHDGDADNALISGLNITAGYTQFEADFSRSRIYAEADYSLNVSIVSLTPYVAFSTENDTDDPADDNAQAYRGVTSLAVGAGLETEALDIFLAPSLIGAVNYRNATYTPWGAGATDWTANELQWSVGLRLNEFIFENSSLTAKYGSWSGTNVNFATNSVGAGDGATDISGVDVDGTGDQSTTGYEIIWDYWDLQFAYGVYENTDSRGTASAQAFSISYAVTF